jgi:Ser/Thr protein kinase RdoA (MazF antagonist)
VGQDADLAGHLHETYGIDVAGLSTMDRDVYRVDRVDGAAWVARVFPAQRGVPAVEGDEAILRALEGAGFPAERCAGPVSNMDGRPVLVTEFVPGERAPARARTYAILGALLGRLHSRPTRAARPGGAWHHLCPQGGPAEEIAAALALLDGRGLAEHRLRATVADTAGGRRLPRTHDRLLERWPRLEDAGEGAGRAAARPDTGRRDRRPRDPGDAGARGRVIIPGHSPL